MWWVSIAKQILKWLNKKTKWLTIEQYNKKVQQLHILNKIHDYDNKQFPNVWINKVNTINKH